MLAFSNEVQVSRRILVLVVAGAVSENDVQADIKSQVVDFAIQIWHSFSTREENGTRVIGQEPLAAGNQFVRAGFRLFGKREKNIVSKHKRLIPPSTSNLLAPWPANNR
jgi:hypothetical protein